MERIGDRWNQFTGKTRFVVCRTVVHLHSAEIAPLLGLLNHAGRRAIEAEGDLAILGEDLAEITRALLELQPYWQSACNEGDVFWSEADAADYVDELFASSAECYQGEWSLTDSAITDTVNEAQAAHDAGVLSLPVTENLIVALTIAAEGEVPELETDLAEIGALMDGLKAIAKLHYQERLRAIQVHFLPARLGDLLSDEQVLTNFPELIPL